MADSFPETHFKDTAALIFGAAKGIGRAVALEWARRGAAVAVADIDEAAAQATAADIEAAGGRAIALKVDVLSDESVQAASEAAACALGEIDIVMSNVGSIINGHPEDIPMSEWRRIMDINYFSATRCIKHFLPRMLARKSGHLVTTASFAGLYPYAASRMPYASAKAAVIALSESLAIYAEPLGVRVTCLIPGPVMTNVMDSMTNWTENCPMRGPGSELELKLPEDVAVTLSDAMCDGRILVASDERVWDLVKQWADGPDAFIRRQIDAFANGDLGAPSIPAELMQLIRQKAPKED